MQKKLMANVFSKNFLKNLKGNTFRHLQERGFLSYHDTYNTSLFMQQEYLPKAEKMNEIITFVDDDLLPLVKQEIDVELLERHKQALQKEKDRITNLEEAKKRAKEAADEAERQRREAQLKRREERRVNRITENVKTKIVAQFSNRKDITSLPLMDIDELSIKGESIHCLGGQLGEILFVFNEIFKNVIEPEKSDTDIKKLMKDFLKEFLNTGFAGIIPVKPDPNQQVENPKQQSNQQQVQPQTVALPNHINSDNFILELRYLESPKYDWENIPEEKRNDFANFLKDDRRYISKSVHKLIELGIIKKEFLDIFNEVISEIYFQGPIEPEKIEPDPSRAEDAAYQEEIKKQQEEAEKKAQEENVFNEKIKKRIKISIIKPEVFKKKRDNIGGFITVEPNPFDFGVVEEIEEIPISHKNTEKKNEENNGENVEQENKEQKEEENKGNAETEGGEKKEEEKAEKPEEKEEKKEENPEQNIEEKKEGEENKEVVPNPENEQHPQEGQVENKEQEQPKEETQIVTTEIDYLTQIQCYKNTSIDIDAFVFHYGMTQWYQALILRALRRVIKKELGIEFGLVDMFQKVQESYKSTADTVIKNILEKETYIGKSIIHVPVSNVPTEEEKQEEVKDTGGIKSQKTKKI